MVGSIYDILSRKKEETERDIKVSIFTYTILVVLEAWIIFTGLYTICKYQVAPKIGFGLALIVFGVSMFYITAQSVSERVHAHIQKFWNCTSVAIDKEDKNER